MAQQIADKKPKTVIEIGTAYGETFWLLCQICPDDATLISVDMPNGAFGGGYTEKDIPRLKAFAKKDQTIHCILGDSHLEETKSKISEQVKGGIDVLIIDGDHSYEGVKKDFEMYSPLVNQDGLIFFHDIVFHPFNPSCEVNLFWRQIKQQYDIEEFVDQNEIHWGGIGMMRWQGSHNE